MTVPVVSILTADLGPQLEEENAELLCRVQELVAEVDHWKAQAYAAHDELGSLRLENVGLRQQLQRKERRGW